MRRRNNLRNFFIAASVATFLFRICAGPGQKLPASTIIGTNPAGSLFYSVASGLAKVISGAGPMQAMVQPYTGSSTFLPMLDNGELDFGIINAVDMGMAYQGPKFKDRRSKPAAVYAQRATHHARFAFTDKSSLAQRRSSEKRHRCQRQTGHR